MLKGISDTNTEEQIFRSLDVLKDFVLSSSEETKQHFKRVESDIKEFRLEVDQRFERVESDIKEVRNDIKEIKESIEKILLRLPPD